MTKDEILNFVYLDPSGYGSAVETYKEARKKDRTITMQDERIYCQTQWTKEAAKRI